MRWWALALLQMTSRAEVLPVVPMQMDPDRLVRSLRDRKPVMPLSDCNALNLWECHPEEPRRVTDISIRWVQLDNDPELEAIIALEAEAEDSYIAFVFDKRSTWNLVGSFFCRRHRGNINSLVRVQKLTEDSPQLVMIHRDLGGSGSTILTTEAFRLLDGRLWPALNVTNYEASEFPSPMEERQQVLASDDRIVIHTVRKGPPGQEAVSKCEVRRWNHTRNQFVIATADQTKYCDQRTGKPISSKSFPTGLPVYP